MGRPHQYGKMSAATIPGFRHTTHVADLNGAAWALWRARRIAQHLARVRVDQQVARTIVYRGL